MRKISFAFAAMMLAPCLFAVDGVVLINQSTVIAAGGFPYTITQPGSYKLSGNLIAPTNAAAIQISANNVALDLNGFSVSCPASVASACISSASRNTAIRNGTIAGSAAPGGAILALGLFSASNIILEELQIDVNVSVPSDAMLVGADSILRHVIMSNTGSVKVYVQINCPSLVAESVFGSSFGLNLSGGGCVTVNNVGS